MSRLKKHYLFSRCYEVSDALNTENGDFQYDVQFSMELNEYILDIYDDEDLVMNKVTFHQSICDGIILMSAWIDFVHKRDSTDIETLSYAIRGV